MRGDRPVAEVSEAGRSSDGDLLSVASRSVLAGAQESATRSLELWARPRSSGRHPAARNRLSLEWGGTRVRFRARLASRRFTHVVVEWSDEALRLFFDGNLVDAVSMGAPSEVGRAHRLALTGPVRPIDLRSVTLYRHGLEIRSVRRHYRLGAEVFGRRSTSRPQRTATGPVAHAAAVPGNTALPTITGTAKDGQTLTSTTGTWSGSPTSYARAWQRCDSVGANCVAISGATATTYLLTSADVGKTVRVKVTATNASGSGNATSGATAVVAAAAPVNTAAPTITGTAKDGQTLTSTTGTWTGTTPISYARQWRRCDTAGANCTDISGATATTYALGANDIGQTIKVVITATNTAGNASATSAATATVTAAAPVNTAVPVISGTAKEGQQLTATTGTWTGSATIAYTYQWQSCNSSCTSIAGATLSSYRLASAEVGKTVKVVVTATNSVGNAASTSAATASVTAGPPVSLAAPTVSGTAGAGQTLTTVNGTWAGTATISYTRQWKRCNSAGASCVAISGAIGTTYTLTSADVGSTVRATWTATNGQGSATADSAATAAVTAQPPTNTAAPAITGTAKDGQTLTSTTGTWTGSATITYTRQWKRCDGGGANCTNISGATATTYVLTGSDIGSTIKVAVTATNSAGSSAADSATTVPVIGSAPVNTALPAITGTAKDGQTLTTTNGTWSGSATIAYAREWKRCNTSGSSCVTIAGATDPTYAVTATDVGQKIRVAVTATNAVGSAVATSASTATVTAIAPANTAPPTIEGAAKEGLRVTANAGSWSGSAPLTYTYTWQQCDGAGANCVDDVTNSFTYLNGSYLGKTVRLKVMASNSAGSGTAYSAVSDVITPSAPVAGIHAVAVVDWSSAPDGALNDLALIAGMRVSTNAPSFDGSKPITITRQWMRCDAQGQNCYDQTGATGTSLITRTWDVGYTFRVRLTGTNAYGTDNYVTDPSDPVIDGNPINITPPTVTGTSRNHQSLSAGAATWEGPLPTNYVKHIWQRCDQDGDSCVPISDQSLEEYELTDADVGHRLRVDEQVTYAFDDSSSWYGRGVGEQISAPTAVITDASTPPVVTLGGDLVADPDQWLDGDTYTLSVSAVAGSDADGLASVAVLYDGQTLADYDGCDGPSCSVSHDVDVTTGDTHEGTTALFVVVTDRNGTETTERRAIHVDREAPRLAQSPLIDMAADGTATITWEPSNSSDAETYQVLRRSSPDDPFEVIGTTQDTWFIDASASTVAPRPLARRAVGPVVPQVRATAESSLLTEGEVEYALRTLDQAGGTSEDSATVAAAPSDTLAPSPTQVEVDQSGSGPVTITWDTAPGAAGYAVYRSLDADAETVEGNQQTRGAAELVADVPADVTDVSDDPSVAGRYTYSVRSVGEQGQLGELTTGTPRDVTPTHVPPSQEVLDHARDVEAFLEDGGAPGRERVECDTICKLLRDAERKLPSVGKRADRVAGQLVKLRARVGAWPALVALADVPADAVIGPFLTGWEIGSYARKAFFTEPVVAPVPEIASRRLVAEGGIAGTWACTPDYYNSACIGNGGTAIVGHLLAPTLGAVGRNASGGQILYESWGDDCSSTEAGPEPEAHLPGGWGWLTDTGPCPFWWAAKDKHWVPFRRVRLGTPASAPDVKSTTGRTVPTVKPGEHVKTEQESEQALLDALQNAGGEYTALVEWLNARLGHRTSDADGTPSCSGMTYEACVSAFKHAGFKGPFTETVLSDDEAWVGQPGDSVVDTTPWSDDDPDDTGGPVTISVNPPVMPTWTVEDEEIAQHLEDNNPVSDNVFFTETIVENLARRCRIRAAVAGLPRSDCWSLPTMITGGLDALGPANNDVLALARHPRWVGLNRRPDTDPKVQWYLDRATPAPGCVRLEVDGLRKNPAGMDCDEYPMWRMAQGYQGDLQTEVPNLAFVVRAQNVRQGRVLQQFYSSSPGPTLGFRGCNIPVQPPRGSILPDTVPPTFLAIPMPARFVPSFGICNEAP